jgi:hypothetical protein
MKICFVVQGFMIIRHTPLVSTGQHRQASGGRGGSGGQETVPAEGSTASAERSTAATSTGESLENPLVAQAHDHLPWACGHQHV